MKKDFEYMSRSEILSRIEKMQKSAQYLSAKFGVDHLLAAHEQHLEKEKKKKEVGDYRVAWVYGV